VHDWATKWRKASKFRLSSLDQSELRLKLLKRSLTERIFDIALNLGYRPVSLLARAGLPVSTEQLHQSNQFSDPKDWKESDVDPSGLPTFPPRVLNPRSFARLCWDIFLVLAVWYSLFVVTFRLGFEMSMFDWRLQQGDKNWGFYNSSRMYFEYAADVVFVINFVLMFRTAYFRRSPDHSRYELVVDPAQILRHYLKTSFVLDLACAVPFEAIYNLYYYLSTGKGPDEMTEQFLVPMAFTRAPRILLIGRFKKMFMTTRVPGMDRYILLLKEELALRAGLVRMFKFSFAFLLSLHVIACVLFWLGSQYEYFKVFTENQPNHWATWLAAKGATDEVPTKSWITEVKLVSRSCDELTGKCQSGRMTILEAPTSGQYLMSVYWVATTMTTVGYGDLHPFTQFEIISLIFGMVIGASMFSYMVGNAEQLISELKVRGTLFFFLFVCVCCLGSVCGPHFKSARVCVDACTGSEYIHTYLYVYVCLVTDK
jgi:hypothetical protein